METTQTSEKPLKDYPVGYHPNSLKNLKPYPPGVSGNPAGKPSYKKLLEEALPTSERAQILQRLAKREDQPSVALQAVKYLDDRTEGPVPQTVNVNKLSIAIDFNELADSLEMLQGESDNAQIPQIIEGKAIP